MAYSKEQLVEMYKIMQRCRLFDKKIATESKKGKLVGMFHFGTNQEAFEAGLMPLVGPDDYIKPYHRNHGCFTMCDMKLYVAGMLERTTGYNMGIGGDYHQQDIQDLHLLPIDGLIGADWLYDAGVAMALKLQKKPGVVFSCQGDGAAQMGSLYESMNFAWMGLRPIVEFMYPDFVVLAINEIAHGACKQYWQSSRSGPKAKSATMKIRISSVIPICTTSLLS